MDIKYGKPFFLVNFPLNTQRRKVFVWIYHFVTITGSQKL